MYKDKEIVGMSVLKETNTSQPSPPSERTNNKKNTELRSKEA